MMNDNRDQLAEPLLAARAAVAGVAGDASDVDQAGARPPVDGCTKQADQRMYRRNFEWSEKATKGSAFVASLGHVDDSAPPVTAASTSDTFILSVRPGVMEIWSWKAVKPVPVHTVKLVGEGEVTALAVIKGGDTSTNRVGDEWIIALGWEIGQNELETRVFVVRIKFEAGNWGVELLREIPSTHSKRITSIVLSSIKIDRKSSTVENAHSVGSPLMDDYSPPATPTAISPMPASDAHTLYLSCGTIISGSSTPIETPIVAAMSSGDRSSSIWHLGSSKCMYKLDPDCHTDQVMAIALHDKEPGEAKVVTGGYDKALRFWDVNLHTTQENTSLKDKDTNAGDKDVIFAHNSKITCIALYEVFTFDHAEDVQNGENTADLQNQPGSRRSYTVLVTGSMDKTVVLWGYDTMEKIRIMKGHTVAVSALAVHGATGRADITRPPLIISGSLDCTVIIWDMMTGHAMRTLPTAEPVASLSCSEDAELGGLLVVTGGSMGFIQFWDLAHSGRTEKFGPKIFGPVTGLATFRDPSDSRRTHLLVGDAKGAVTTFNLSDPSCAHIVQQVNESKHRLNNLLIGAPFPPSGDTATPLESLINCDLNPFFVTCDGNGAITGFDLQQHIERGIDALILPIEANKKVVFALAIFDPRKIRTREDGTHIEQANVLLELPYIISGGLEDICFWDISYLSKPFNAAEPPKLLNAPNVKIVGAHSKGKAIRSFALYHPVVKDHHPLLVSSAWDNTVKVWDLTSIVSGDSTCSSCLLRELKGHSDNVLHVFIYDPFDRENCATEKFTESPIAITGSNDCTIKLWNLFTGECLNTLRGHSEAVTAMDLYVPKIASEPPLLATGSIDRLIMVWNVWTGERIHTLVGHSDRVCCLHVHRPANQFSQPWLASGGDDKVVFIWKDALYLESFMPLHDAVVRAFEADLVLSDWPRMSKLVLKYEGALFLENLDLFARAVHNNRPDFLLKFRIYLSMYIRHAVNVNFSVIEGNGQSFDVVKHSSLLTFAMHKGDMISVRAILLCWVENLNKDIPDLLTQNAFHACHFFCSLGQLEELSKKYPLEYSLFICAVQLVRNHPSLVTHCCKSGLHHRLRYEVAAAPQHVTDFQTIWQGRLFADDKARTYHLILMQFWKIVWFLLSTTLSRPESNYRVSSAICIGRAAVSSAGDVSGKLPVVSLLLPLRYPLAVQGGFTAMLDVSNKLNSLNIFNSVVAIYSSQYYWHDYGRFLHFAVNGRFILFLTAFIVFIHLSLEESFVPSAVGRFYCALLLVYLFCYLFKEGVQAQNQRMKMYDQNNGVRQPTTEWCSWAMGYWWWAADFLWNFFTFHLQDVWNVMDLFVVLSGISGLTMVLATGKMSTHARCILAWCSVAMWIRLMFFFRPFSNAGPLVVMILRIAWDIRFFMAVLLCFIMGFAQAFWLLSYQNRSLPFAKFGNSMLNTYYYMLGLDVDTNFYDTISPGLATFMLSLFTLIMMILMLNLLIALMGNTYSEIREMKSAPWRKERVAVMCELAVDCKIKVNPNTFIHVLKYTSDVASIHDDNDNENKNEKNLISAVNESRALLVNPYNLDIAEMEDIQEQEREREQEQLKLCAKLKEGIEQMWKASDSSAGADAAYSVPGIKATLPTKA